MAAYRYIGTEPTVYSGWTAKPGDVASFPLAPPEHDKWELIAEEETAPGEQDSPREGLQPGQVSVPGGVTVQGEQAGSSDGTGQGDQTTITPHDGQHAVKQPNKAASAAEWVAFAKADGGFREQTGKDPEAETTTRKAIVDFYTGDSDGDE